MNDNVVSSGLNVLESQKCPHKATFTRKHAYNTVDYMHTVPLQPDVCWLCRGHREPSENCQARTENTPKEYLEASIRNNEVLGAAQSPSVHVEIPLLICSGLISELLLLCNTSAFQAQSRKDCFDQWWMMMCVRLHWDSCRDMTETSGLTEIRLMMPRFHCNMYVLDKTS